jgi:hypothetical protein
MKRFAPLALAALTLSLCAAEFHPFDGPKPVAVLIQTDPWAMVIGADSPRVAVYEDRVVIFFRKSKEGGTYHYRKLSEAEFSDIEKHLAPVVGLKELKHFYSLRPNVTDQPEAIFYARELVTRVYGLKAPGTKLGDSYVRSDGRKPDDVPDELRELHNYLCSRDYRDSKEWSPKYVEVMIWPYEYAPDASIVWPKEWPALNSDRARKRGDSYSIFLDGTVLPRLQRFLQTRKEKGAVEIRGKKWAVSFRAVFPSEPIWKKSFEGAKEK